MQKFDMIILGAGPGGYETAAAAASRGLSVALVERDLLSGTCLNRGCIPTKALCRTAAIMGDIAEAATFGIDAPAGVHADYGRAIERKNSVVTQLREMVAMSLRGVTVIEGEGSIAGSGEVVVGDEHYAADRIVIATGSAPVRLPIEGADLAITSDELLALESLPARVTIIGGGVIGMEFACILNAFGCQVTVIEYCKEILPPFDRDIAKRLRMSLGKRGVSIIVGAAVTAIAPGAVTYEAKGKSVTVECDMAVMAVGRRPVVPAGVEEAGVSVTRRGIQVDPATFETNVPGIYAIGDVNGLCMLAHAATAQGMKLLGEDVNLSVIPAAVFTTPECAMAGATEEQCKEAGRNVAVAKIPFRGNGKALAMGEADGLVKMIVDRDTRRIAGCHICGPHAADLIQEVSTVMSNDGTIDAILRAVHGHPTLGEAVQAAARACAAAL